ncbi:MAG TPA: excinuclease ABC subunit UvrC [Vicinamibacterales bacterium]|nr:excinuclease ABC subunit UvrC [Vicinamibacterales bacterium]
MPIRDLKAQIARLPEQPGVYLYSNGAGETLYVGKARVLRDRVRSYLGAHGTSPRIDALLDEAQHLEVIVTDSVMEALALENHLIKQRAPRYNILLRDDKNYPYLQLTTGEAFPRVLVARRVERDGHFYAGPFLPAWLGRRTMSLTHRLFGIRSCNEVITGERGRPCLEYDIKRCLAPCVREICSADEYRVAVGHTKLFLEGRNEELVAELRQRMAEAASAERFEQAAQLRDAIRVIETVRTSQQKMASAELGDRDAFGIKVGPAGAVVQIFQVRGGKVVERIELATDVETSGGEAGRAIEDRAREVQEAALQQFYEDRVPPPEIHVPAELPRADQQMLESWLETKAARRVRLLVPRRGGKRGLLDLATRNAEVAYQQRFNENVAAHYDALETLRVVLGLPATPRRIECFDISTIQGSETVASMVVCEDGRMRRSEYRKFRIRGMVPLPGAALGGESSGRAAAARLGGAPSARNDDFAAMREVVLRRYRRVLAQGGPFPDLLLIDGGKGQLTAAYSALEELGLGRLVAVGIAKKEELLFTRDRHDPLALAPESPALLLIQRIRDEAHRFAVTFHRQARTRRDLRSELDAIGGVGPRRRKALLTAFGSVAGVRRATREELVRVVGARCADAVLAHFASQRH